MSLIQETSQHQIVHSRRKEHSLVLQGFDRRDQIASCVGFEHESARARVEGFTDNLIGIGDRQDNDFELRIVLQQLTCGVQSVEEWHANVEDHNIGLQLCANDA